MTPEIAELPAGMGDLRGVWRQKAAGSRDMTAALIASLFDRGVDVHVAVPHYRGLFGPFGDGLDPWGRTRTSRMPGARLHLAEHRLF